MEPALRFTRVDFTRFKAFNRFTLHLRHFNILVGPNNAGKSTVLTAFRILAAAMRRARARNPARIHGIAESTSGYEIDITGISVAEENLFYNYDDSEPAIVRFQLSNKRTLTLVFPEQGICRLFADGPKGSPRSTVTFKREFDCEIGFVPVLGPVDHREQLYLKEAARLALYNYTAARNFRNIWYHFPEKFGEFRKLLNETWPGMDVEAPVVDHSHKKPVLHMFCPEERIPREIFWAGFGFQVWCQMLTHIVQASGRGIFLIDEPDIYLHADLQRQLIGLLRDISSDVLIATHSTEMITEAEPDDIVLVDKKRQSSRRIKQPAELTAVFYALGSNLNPILTQVAKTRRVMFVEGSDFQLISRFARKLGNLNIANRSDFAVAQVGGFSPDRIRSLKEGMETTLGGKVAAAAILDRDYRSSDECQEIAKQCQTFCHMTFIHDRKEIENYLLDEEEINQSALRRVKDRNKRTGKKIEYVNCAAELLSKFIDSAKTSVTSQRLAFRRRYDRKLNPGFDEATSNERALSEIENQWQAVDGPLGAVPGKEAIGSINQELQSRFGVNVTPTAIIDAMRAESVPQDIRQLVQSLDEFSKVSPKAAGAGQ